MYLGEVDHADRYHRLHQPDKRQSVAVSIRLNRKQEAVDRKREQKAIPAADLHRLHIEVWPQDVDVGIQVEGSGSLTLSCLPHLNCITG